MAIEDKDLLKLICERYPDQPLTYVMEQFGQAKAMCLQIERTFNAPEVDLGEEAEAPAEEAVETEVTPEAPKKKRLTRRSLVCKPAEAITDEYITCCICGRKMKTITSMHLKSHDVTVEEYKKLCGYAPEQKLMSNTFAEKMTANIKAAQEGRTLKRMEAQYSAEQDAAEKA